MDQYSLLFKKVYGCVMGGAIGDAFGGPVETMDWQYIRKLTDGGVTDLIDYHIRPDDFFQPEYGGGYAWSYEPGTYTDDSYFASVNAQCIIEKGGRINCDDLADYWMKHLDMKRGWFSVNSAYWKMAMTRKPAREIGANNIGDNSSAMCVGPIGVINAGNPAQASLDAYDVVSLLHHEHSREAAGVLAAAVAEALNPDATIDSIVEASIENIPNGEYSRMYEPMLLAVELARKAANSDELTRLYYAKLNIEWSGRKKPLCTDGRHNESCEAYESVPCAIGMFVNAGGDFKKTILGAGNYGRDCDTIACMAGYIAGALNGIDAIPERWIETCLKANPDPNLFQLSQRLTDTLVQESKRMLQHYKKILALA